MGRLPRNKRVTDAPSMRLTDRDIQIIKAVLDFRVLRGDQIQALFFGSQSTASYRLSRLFQHGYLERHFLPTLGGLASSPTLYTIDQLGIAVLRKAFELGPEAFKRRLGKKELSPIFLDHILEINEVRIAATLAVNSNGFELLHWIDDATLKSDYDRVTITTIKGKKQSVSLIPDGYFSLQVPQGQANFFLELDRGTMTNLRFQKKVLAYQAYIRSSQYQSRYKTKSLRVLTVTSGIKRLKNLKKHAEEVGGEKMFWFTTLSQISANTIFDGAIWEVASRSENEILIPKIETPG